MREDQAYWLFLTVADATLITGYKRLDPPPVVMGAEATYTGAGAVGAGEVLIKAFVSDALGLTALASGTWTFNLYGKVDSATDMTQIVIRVYKRNSAGTETELFNVTSSEINDAVVALQTVTYAYAGDAVAITDRLAIKFYHKTDSASSKTTTLYLEGAVNQSRANISFPVRVGDGDMEKTLYNPEGDGIIPRLTGPITSVGNATTITDKAVTLAKMDDMATASLIYRKTAGVGVPEINSLATLKTDLGSMPASSHNILDSTIHGDVLTGTVVDGDIIIGNVTPKWSKLAISIPAASVRNVLGIDNGELRPSWKTALDATAPTTITAAGSAAAGTSLVFAHRDHAHPITGAPALLGNGASQYQVIVTGATPFVPVYSGFLLDGTTGGKTVLAVTSGKVLTLTAVDNYNLTVPATGTAALLNQANSFTLINPLTTIAESWIGPSSTAGIYFKSGNVGIGTTGPNYPLDVVGRSRVRGGSGTLGGGFWLSTSAAPTTDISYIGRSIDSEGQVGIYNNGAWRLVVNDTSGNVGIGTTGPGSKLQVYGSGGVLAYPDADNGDNGIAATATAGQVITSNTSIARLYVTGANTAHAGKLDLRSGSVIESTINMWNLTGTNTQTVLLSSAGSSYLNGGNVGIGTTGPGASLDIHNTSDKIGLQVQGFSTQTNNLQEWLSSAPAILSHVNSNGTLDIGIATGTAPLVIASTTVVTNLNADLLDGLHTTDLSIVKQNISITARTTAIGSTNITGTNTAGLYRVSYYLEDTTADITAGTIQVTFGWTDDAGATTSSSVALPLTAVGRATGMIYVRVLGTGSIQYSTTLAGVIGTSQYALYASCEKLL